MLYIFWFLHQTTTLLLSSSILTRCISFDSYIKPQLVIFLSRILVCCISFDSYIKPQLIGEYGTSSLRCISFDSYIKPQRTRFYWHAAECCISFDSYIKPQPERNIIDVATVVYLLIPTSNHNFARLPKVLSTLYIFWFLHQTTTMNVYSMDGMLLYIFWFLHQTTTYNSTRSVDACCISFDSYIKPQQRFCPF